MIAAIKEGNKIAYEQAFAEKRQRLYHYFLKRTTLPDDAKDLVQITFLRLWQYRSSLSPDYSLEQQLFHIARTVFIDHLRRQRRQQQAKQQIAHYLVDRSPEIPIAFDLNHSLFTVLNKMPAMRSRVFRMHRLEGYSYGEIAQVLCIPVKSVDNYLAKAVRHLKTITWV